MDSRVSDRVLGAATPRVHARVPLLVLVAAALVGCASTPVPASPSRGLSDDDALHVEVLRTILSELSSERPRFVCIYGGDPSDEVLAAIQPASFVNLQVCCDAPILQPPPSDPGFVIVSVYRTLDRTASTAVVVAGFDCGWLCADWAEYHCRRDAQGRWTVDHKANRKLS